MSSLRKFVPSANRILVRRSKPITTTPGGLHLPESSINRNSEGEVLAIGPEAGEIGIVKSLSLQVGDKILLPEHSGVEFKMNGEKFNLYHLEEILGKFEH